MLKEAFDCDEGLQDPPGIKRMGGINTISLAEH